jgi:prepilin signal peptidase PulO-like enzyme (type II secretory pathway)
MERNTFSWRQLLRTVNLRDFAQMVGGELGMVWESFRLASESASRMPFGPFVFVAGVLMAFLRLVLLVLVVIIFGATILVIAAVRGVASLSRKRGEAA